MKKKTTIREPEKQSAKKIREQVFLAHKRGYYLEASWMLSALFDRKIRRLIYKLEGSHRKVGITFEQAIKRIKYLHLSGNQHGFTETFSIELIDRLRKWKNQRNLILKDMIDVHVSQARMERLAKEGMQLLQAWNKAVKSFKKADRSKSATLTASGAGKEI